MALAKNGAITDLIEDKSGSYSHAEKLHGFIKQIIFKNDFEFSDLDGVAVSKGPGSYTGLRIGVAAAKGLCLALDIPLISVDTNDVYHEAIASRQKPAVVLFNSRKNEVYAAEYNGEGDCTQPVNTVVLDKNSYNDALRDREFVFIGNGVEKLLDITSLQLDNNDERFLNALPSAGEMLVLAEEKLKKSDTEDVAYFEPEYLKPVWAKKMAQ